jgi:glycosyltransferase involved in cell wall biosynthesis
MNVSQCPSVSIVIPVFKGADSLFQCLAALDRQVYPRGRYEILVVFNDTEDHSDAPLLQNCFVKYLHEPRPGSYSARNRGILAANGSILAFTDADCIPDPRWLNRGVQALVDNPRSYFVAGSIEFIPVATSRKSAAQLYERIIYFRQKTYVCEYGFAATANMFVRREVMDQVGLFEGTLKSGGDVDWGLRAKSLGFTGVYEPSAIVRHKHRTFLELLAKARRVAGGVVDRDKLHNQTRIRFALFDLKDELRILRHDLALIDGSDTPGTTRKAYLRIIATQICCLRLAERWRIRLGGTSLRG